MILSNTTWTQVMQKYAAGVRLKELSEMYGVSAPAITQHAQRHGVMRNQTPNPKVLAKEVERIDEEEPKPTRPLVAVSYDTSATEIIRLHRAGRSRSEIGALLRIPYRQIDAAIEQAGASR